MSDMVDASKIAEVCQGPLARLLPHRAPMILIDEACGMEGDSFMAKVHISRTSPFFKEAGVPGWVGLEYMAQTVAAYSGALGLASGSQIKVGMLLGTREYHAEVPFFPEGQELEVLVRIDIFQENGVSSMDCQIRNPQGRILAKAQVNVIDIPDIQNFFREKAE